MVKIIKKIKEKITERHTEKFLLKNGFVRCANCNNLILGSHNYCMYCGKANLTKVEDKNARKNL